MTNQFEIKIRNIYDDFNDHFFEDYSPEYRYIPLKNDEFLDDVISNEDIAKWRCYTPVFISSQTGTGKTQFVFKELIARVFDARKSSRDPNEHRILLLVNRTALARQVKRKVAQELRMLGVSGITETMEALTDIGLDKQDTFGFVDVLTYQSLNHEFMNSHSEWEYDYVVMDEAHFFAADSLFNADTAKILSEIIHRFEFSVRIYITATPEIVLEPILRLENFTKRYMETGVNPFGQIVDYVVREEDEAHCFYFYDIASNFNYIRSINVFTPKRKKEKFKPLVKEIKDSNKEWLIFVESKKNGLELSSTLKNEGIQADFISADDKRSEAYIELTNKEKNLHRVLIATSVADNGINIHNPELVNVLIDTYDRTEFIQMLGRVRVPDRNAPLLNLYVFERTEQDLENDLKDYQKLLAIRMHADWEKNVKNVKNYLVDYEGFNIDNNSALYYSKMSIPYLLGKVSELRRILRLAKMNPEYFPSVSKAVDVSAREHEYAIIRNALEKNDSDIYSKRLFDAFETAASFSMKKHRCERAGVEMKNFKNNNSGYALILKMRLKYLSESLPITKDKNKQIKELKKLIDFYQDVPCRYALKQVSTLNYNVITSEYAHWLGVSLEKINYLAFPCDDDEEADENSVVIDEEAVRILDKIAVKYSVCQGKGININSDNITYNASADVIAWINENGFHRDDIKKCFVDTDIKEDNRLKLLKELINHLGAERPEDIAECLKKLSPKYKFVNVGPSSKSSKGPRTNLLIEVQ